MQFFLSFVLRRLSARIFNRNMRRHQTSEILKQEFSKLSVCNWSKLEDQISSARNSISKKSVRGLYEYSESLNNNTLANPAVFFYWATRAATFFDKINQLKVFPNNLKCAFLSPVNKKECKHAKNENSFQLLFYLLNHFDVICLIKRISF